MLLLRERKIDAPFGMSPNSFSTSWISFKDEDGLAFFTDTFQLVVSHLGLNLWDFLHHDALVQ